eukprot:PhM_4_TR13582/c0_g1_i1/m.13021
MSDDSEQVSAEEMNFMREDLTNKCSDIQQLLHTMVKTERMMREDVRDAIIQDYEEDISCQEITGKVLEEEKALCGDPDYLRFLMGREGGADAAVNPDNHVLRPAWMQDPAMFDAMHFFDIVIALPDVVRDYLLGGERKAYLHDDVVSFFAEYYEAAAAAGIEPSNLISFVNGVPVDDVSSDEEIHEVLTETPALAEAVNRVALLHAVHQCCTVGSPESLIYALKTSVVAQAHLAESKNEAAPVVCLQSTSAFPSIPLRVFVLKGRVIAMEQELPSVYHKEFDDPAVVTSLRRKTVDLVEGLVGVVSNHPRRANLVMRLSCRVGPSSSSSAPTTNCDVNSISDATSDDTVDVAVTHVEVFHPGHFQSAFFTWSDIAGMMKLRVSSSEDVVFRRVITAPETIAPYNDLAKRIGQVKAAGAVRNAIDVETKLTRSRRNSQLIRLVAGTAAICAAVVGLGTFVRAKK